MRSLVAFLIFFIFTFPVYAYVVELSCKKNITKSWNEVLNPKTEEDMKKAYKVETKAGEGAYAYIKIDTKLKELTYFDLEEQIISFSINEYADEKQTYSDLKITEDFYEINTKYKDFYGDPIDAITIIIKINRQTGYAFYRYIYDGTGPVKREARRLIRYICSPTSQLF